MPHVFRSSLQWSGATSGPTRDPATFSRDLEMSFESVSLPMSSAPGYRGDPSRANPEQLLVAAVSSCHALTYLFHTAKNGVAVVSYKDDAQGELALVDGRMRMARVILRPRVTLEAGSDEARARELVDKAHRDCFISNSILTQVSIEPTFEFANVPLP
jgi:organic hydroperoxide reductase OsmC/OhrA